MNLIDTIEDMTSPDYNKRFLAEYNQLNIRYKKLCEMMDKYEEGKLDFIPKTPIEIFRAQAVYMLLYKAILLHRAEEFENIDLEEDSLW